MQFLPITKVIFVISCLYCLLFLYISILFTIHSSLNILNIFTYLDHVLKKIIVYLKLKKQWYKTLVYEKTNNFLEPTFALCPFSGYNAMWCKILYNSYYAETSNYFFLFRRNFSFQICRTHGTVNKGIG